MGFARCWRLARAPLRGQCSLYPARPVSEPGSRRRNGRNRGSPAELPCDCRGLSQTGRWPCRRFSAGLPGHLNPGCAQRPLAFASAAASWAATDPVKPREGPWRCAPSLPATQSILAVCCTADGIRRAGGGPVHPDDSDAAQQSGGPKSTRRAGLPSRSPSPQC